MGSLGFGCCIYRNCVQCLRLLCFFLYRFVIMMFIYPNSAGYLQWRWGKCMINPVGYNRLELIDLSHKSDKISVSSSTMHHFVTERCTNVHISVTKSTLCDIYLVHCEIHDMDLLKPNAPCKYHMHYSCGLLYVRLSCKQLCIVTGVSYQGSSFQMFGDDWYIYTGTKCPTLRKHFEKHILDRKETFIF